MGTVGSDRVEQKPPGCDPNIQSCRNNGVSLYNVNKGLEPCREMPSFKGREKTHYSQHFKILISIIITLITMFPVYIGPVGSCTGQGSRWLVRSLCSIHCSNVNSGLNINQESTHTPRLPWPRVPPSLPSKSNTVCQCQAFSKLWRMCYLPERWTSMFERYIILFFITSLKVFPERKELTVHSIPRLCVSARTQVPTGGWYLSWALTTYQSSLTGITDGQWCLTLCGRHTHTQMGLTKVSPIAS